MKPDYKKPAAPSELADAPPAEIKEAAPDAKKKEEAPKAAAA